MATERKPYTKRSAVLLRSAPKQNLRKANKNLKKAKQNLRKAKKNLRKGKKNLRKANFNWVRS